MFTNGYILSWAPDKRKLTRPIYLSLAAQLEQDIASGTLTSGTKLPPQRVLADYLNINFTTVTRAYSICLEKGLITAVSGSGTFVSPNTRSFESAVAGSPTALIDLRFIAYFEQTDIVADTVRKVAKKNSIEQLFSYISPTGMMHHKIAAMKWLSTFGLIAEPDQLAITSGSHNSAAVAFSALFKPGSCIATDRHFFASIINIARAFNINLVPINYDNEGMIATELDKCCAQMHIQGVFLTPSCSNPTAIPMTNRRKEELAAVIRKRQLILIENDMYAFLTAGVLSDYKQPMFNLAPENTVYIMDCDAPISSGLRVSYMVYGHKLRERMNNAIHNINIKTSSLNAEIMAELTISGAAQEIIARKTALVREVNDIYYEYFPEFAHKGHPLSLFKWIPISNKHNAIYVESHLQMHSIIVAHSDRFLSGQSQPDNYIRVSLTSAGTPEKLRTGLNILKKQLNDL